VEVVVAGKAVLGASGKSSLKKKRRGVGRRALVDLHLVAGTGVIEERGRARHGEPVGRVGCCIDADERCRVDACAARESPPGSAVKGVE
jgi:hypothetical protein